jgi:phosphate transport system permease protein
MKKIGEKVVEGLIYLFAFGAILIVLAMLIFLFREGGVIFKVTSWKDFLFGKIWLPTHSPPQFGTLPLLWGSIMVSLGALLWSAPLGIGLAIYIAELSSPKMKAILKAFIELLAGIPSVVFGFFGMVILAPLLQNVFSVPTGLCALNASIILGLMALPIITSFSEEAISAVPQSLKEASFAMGATHWQTIKYVSLPVASGGILCGVIMGMGRAIGETMAVLMAAGNAPIITLSFFEPIRTLTATIALEMAEAPKGSRHYHALFALGAILFVISMAFNVIANLLQEKWRRKLV